MALLDQRLVAMAGSLMEVEIEDPLHLTAASRATTCRCQAFMTVPSLRGSTRHAYSVTVARLGMALSPANSAILSSRITGMTWLLRPIPPRLSALRAPPAGVVPAPAR